MSDSVAWLAAEGQEWKVPEDEQEAEQLAECRDSATADPYAHPISTKDAEIRVGQPLKGEASAIVTDLNEEENRERRIYRGRTVALLRRYMRYSIETGRMPSILGREFFRTQVTRYTVVTFEDRVIFVHDMEKCLERLDEFSRQLIGRHILQEHDRWATAKLLSCNEKTVRRLTPIVLDQLSEILMDVGLMEKLESNAGNSCQGGSSDEKCASNWEKSENKL